MELIGYIKIGGIIIGSLVGSISIIYVGFKHYFKTENAKIQIRDTKSIIPEGWFGNLIKLIIRNAQKTTINEGFSIIHVWENHKYVLTCKELLNTNDKDENILFDFYPVLTSFIVTIEEKRRILPKLLTYISVDRTRLYAPSINPLEFERDYIERLNKKPNVYVKGEKVL